METETYNEIELLKASKRGDSGAFEEIVKKYQPLICAITFSATVDFDKSQELAQETFLSAWKDLRKLKDISKFRNWLTSIARNVIRNSIRSQKRDVIRKSVVLDQATDPGGQRADSTETEVSEQQHAVVSQALEQLEPKYREPLVLFYRQEESVKTIAEQLELSEEAVRQRLSRGRKLLKQQVADIVEATLKRSGPGKLFTAAVVASLPVLAPQAAAGAIAAISTKGSIAAKSVPVISILGWIIGPLLGFIGAAIAIQADLKNASKRHRRFIIRSVLIQVVYLLTITSIAVPLVLWWKLNLGRSPLPILVIYFALLFFTEIPFVIWSSRQEKRIQIEEGTYVKPELRALKWTRGQIYGAFGGSIFGSLVWLFRVTAVSQDWVMFSVVLGVGTAIFLSASKLCEKYPEHGFKIAGGVFACVGFLNLAAVNLRWGKWQAFITDPLCSLEFINWTITVFVVVLIAVALVADRRYKKH